jgi:two-component system, OmpR family, alkaline phosphatase synthesis response regulator PhoP
MRVLLIDDEESLLIPMSRYFEKLGWTVTTAREREEAEALLENREFDVIVLDLALSGYGLEGLDLLREVRRGCVRSAVLVLSGVVNSDITAEALRRGADAVFAKPQGLGVIAQKATELLAGRS